MNPTRVGRDPGACTGAAAGAVAGTAADATRARVAISFGSPSADSGGTRLDLNDILVRHPQASYLMRATGQAMREAGIDGGDLLLIDRAITPANGHVVVAVVDDDFVCRRLSQQGGDVRLQATQPGCPDTVAQDGSGLQIWGVVTQVIKAMPV